MVPPSSVFKSVGTGFVTCASYKGCKGMERTAVQANRKRIGGGGGGGGGKKCCVEHDCFFITGWKWDTEWILTGVQYYFHNETELCKKL
jgi:hypothetical protein